MRLEQASSKSGEEMFRYHSGGSFAPQQFQPHSAEYLSQVAIPGPFPENGVVQQHGPSGPTVWTGTSFELTPASSATSTHNATATPAAALHQDPAWGQYNYVNAQPHLAAPPGHLTGSPPAMTAYQMHDGFVAHPPGHHGPDTVAQALYTSQAHFKGPPYDSCWVRTPTYRYNPQTGKTRTKDKYRVVYTDHQRQKLEDEFRFNRYITIRRKAEIAMTLGLSDRQVKIWFQNRRAKERKVQKKLEMAASGQQEKSKAPSQNQLQRAQSTEVKQESKPIVKQEGSAQNTKAETTVAGAPRAQNGVTLGAGNGAPPVVEGVKYSHIRSVPPMKQEYPDGGHMRMIAHGPGLEVTTHMGVAGYPGVSREPAPVPVLQYTTA